jgi:tRNA(Ile)-lysidine synthase
VETVLMHLIRGAGLAGLKGMLYRWQPSPWSSDIPLVRPLLGIWREQILEYVTSHGYQPVFDPSNLDTSFFRNKLRHELIPTLESYNPNARQVIWQTANILLEDYRLIEQLLADSWKECLREAGLGYLGLDIVKVREMSPGLQRHVIRWAAATLNPDIRDLDYAALDRAVSFIESSSVSRKIELWGRISLTLEGNTLWLASQHADLPRDHWPQVNAGEQFELNIPGELRLPCGWALSAVESSLPDWGIQENVDPFQTWINPEAVRQPLIVRSRLAGERFSPLGMDGFSLKVSDFMVNVKLPRRARSGWPLVCAMDRNTLKEEIIWIPGYRQSHNSRVTAGTAQSISLQMHRNPEL